MTTKFVPFLLQLASTPAVVHVNIDAVDSIGPGANGAGATITLRSGVHHMVKEDADTVLGMIVDEI